MSPTEKELRDLLAQRLLILDGAMGTMVQRYKLQEADYRGERFADWPSDVKGNNDLLCITRPDVIREIHSQYIAAGADIIETNTFSGTTIAMPTTACRSWYRTSTARRQRSLARRRTPARTGVSSWPGRSGRSTARSRSRAT